MGREIRRVAPDWEHPRDGMGRYRPLYEGREFAPRLAEWDKEKAKWDRGEFPSYAEPCDIAAGYEKWAGFRPNAYDYMPQWSEAEATHFQMYEDTTEGTPISPVFATIEECARWCADNGASAFSYEPAPYEWWLRVAQGSAGFGLLVNTSTGESRLA